MTDFASIGIDLDARPVVEGTRALDALAETSAKVAQKVTAMNGGMSDTARIMRANAEATKTVDDASAKFLANLQREIDLFGANRAEMERYNAAAAGLSTETQRAAAALGSKIDALRRDEQAARAAAAAEDQATKAADRFIKSLNDQVATLGMNTSQMLAYRAAQFGVSDAAAPLIAKLSEAGAGASSAGKHMEGLSFQSVGARRELLVLAHELSQGNYQKFGGSMMVLGEQTGAAGLLFSAAGLAALGLTAAVVGLGYALIKGASEQRAMNNALIETGHYAGVTGDQLNSMAHAAVEAGGSIREAKKVVAELAGTGKFTGEQIGYITEAAIAMEHATGKSVEKTIKEFESLAVETSGNTLRSTEAISRAALKLDDTYHFLTESVYEQIRALEREGEQKAASALATKTLAEVTDQRAEEMVQSLGYVARAWHGITEFIGKAVDKAGEWGMKVTPAMEVARLTKEIQQLQDGSYASFHGGRDAYNEATLAAMLAADKVALTKAQAELNKVNAAAAAAGAQQIAQSEAKHAASRIEQDDMRLRKKSMSEEQLDIDRYMSDVAKIQAVNPKSALVTDEAVAAHLAAIKKAHAVTVKGNDDRAAVLQDAFTREQTALDRERSIYDARGKMLDLYHTKFGMSDADYYAGREVARAEYVASEASTFAKETALAQGAEAQARNPQEVAAAKGKYDQLVKAHEKFVDDMRNAGGEDRSNADAASQKKYDDIVNATHDAGVAAIKSLDSQIEKQKEHNAEIGKTKEQIELARQAQVDFATVQLQSDADFLRDGLAKWQLDEKSAAVYTMRLNDLDAEIAKRRELAGLHAAGADQESLAKASSDLDKYLDPTKAEKFGNALRGSLDGAAKSMGDLANVMQRFGAQQAANDKARSEAQQLLAGNDAQRAKGLIDLEQINRKGTVEQLAGYGNMAAAAAGFFGQHSRGYRALAAVSQVFHAAELALEMESMATKLFATSTVTAAKTTAAVAENVAVTSTVPVTLAAEGAKSTAYGMSALAASLAAPFPANLAAFATVGAMLAAIGVAVAGASGNSPTLSEERQVAQGAGTVLGDGKAKSESISRAVQLAASNSSTQINYLSGMLTSLRNIETGISSFANQIVSGTDIANPKINLNTNNGLASTATTAGLATGGALLGMTGAAWTAAAGSGIAGSALASLGAAAGPLGAVAGALVGGIISKIPAISNALTSVFGGKQSLQDSGFTMDKASLAAILASGARASSYADVKTDGGWFHGDKSSTQSKSLGQDANVQFSLVIESLADSVTEAGKLLGVSGAGFEAQLNSFVVDIGKVSLKGMTGDEIQKALESVFSKLGDQMAAAAVGGLQQFQKVGEGYLETLVRVASDYAKVDASLQSIGKTFGSVGVQSIAAREGLIALMGGIDQFQSQTASFGSNFLTKQEQLAPVAKYVDDQLAALGLGYVKSRDQFKAVALGQDLSTAAGQKLFASLMGLQEAFAATHAAAVDLTKTEQEVTDERKDLQDQLDQVTMTQAQLAAKARNALAEVNRPLYDLVQTAQKLADTATNMEKFRDAAKSLNDTMLTGSLSVLNPEQQEAELQAQYEKIKAAAMAGDTKAQDQFSGALTAWLTASQKLNSGDTQYQADFAQAQRDSAAAAAWASSQVDTAQAQLNAMNSQTDALQSANGALNTANTILQTIAQNTSLMGGAPSGANVIGTALSALSTAINALKQDNTKLTEQVAALRKDQDSQTGDSMQANDDSAQRAAHAIVDGVTQGVTQAVSRLVSTKSLLV
ncbi:phage tail length tape measure family protein [Herbaspirillum sp. SJZ107]|uniref:phage tail length tape measure family protein n=1 Tax=Herbaspirillum sp. SJZ107 TaxID=2572881 RepID=UPI00114E8F6A|nr:phage tail length tape measure family protein [Herbaspirillum sp. SJZ107]TQK00151.1 tail length tape measure protein [Herbaspirillum sp. SJZ107]